MCLGISFCIHFREAPFCQKVQDHFTLVQRMQSGFFMDHRLACFQKKGDGKREKTIEKITEKECPGLSGMPLGTLPSPLLLIKAGGRGTAESSPSPPLHPNPIWDSSQPKQRNFVMAPVWRSRVEKLILDCDGDHFLLFPIFDRTSVS